MKIFLNVHKYITAYDDVRKLAVLSLRIGEIGPVLRRGLILLQWQRDLRPI